MKRKSKTQFQSMKKRKQRGKSVTISLIITGLLMTGLVIWIAINDWDVERSFGKVKFITDELEQENEEVEKRPDSTELEKGPEEKLASPIEEVPVVEAPDSAKEVTPNIDNREYIEGQNLPSEPTYKDGVLIANKQYPLPATFAPGEDKEALDEFNKMAAKASLAGFNLTAFSTYRSFEYQTELYERYVNKDGKEAADRYSARPGYSEHQTGLAFDIGEVNFEKHWASSSFGDTEAGKWAAANAHHYGFVMRYPKGKEKITGYMHESWHFRYVGKVMASEIYEKNITIEEYLDL